MCSQYFAQLVDLRDLVEPVMPEDWDKYFPDGVQNQYCMSLSEDHAMEWGIWNLITLVRQTIYIDEGGWNICPWVNIMQPFSDVGDGAVASWLVRSSSDRAVRIRGLAWDIV